MKKHLIRPLHPTTGSTECGALEVETRFGYPGMLFLYEDKPDRLRLMAALARVLDDFPQYAGKLVASGVRLQIQHGGGAVAFEHARSDEALDALSAALNAGHARSLEPAVSKLRIAATREAPLAIKFTELRDGCALAVVWNHAVGDMHSTMLLMRAWADAYAGRVWEKPIVLTDRDAYLRSVMPDPGMVRSAARRASLPLAIALRLAYLRRAVRVSVEYSWAQLAAIHQALNIGRPITLNDAVSAHVYTVLRRLAGATEPTNLCLVVNFRKRVGLSSRLIGNMTSLLSQPVDELDTPAQIAASVRDGLEQYASKHANYQATMRVFDAHLSVSQRGSLISRQFSPFGDIMITNWNGFGVYDLAFERAQPVLFRPIVRGVTELPQWVLIVYELPRSRGLALTVGLPPSLAERWSSPEGQALLRRPPSRPANQRPPRAVSHEYEAAPRG